jgi:hypothetical protein
MRKSCHYIVATALVLQKAGDANALCVARTVARNAHDWTYNSCARPRQWIPAGPMGDSRNANAYARQHNFPASDHACNRTAIRHNGPRSVKRARHEVAAVVFVSKSPRRRCCGRRPRNAVWIYHDARWDGIGQFAQKLNGAIFPALAVAIMLNLGAFAYVFAFVHELAAGACFLFVAGGTQTLSARRNGGRSRAIAVAAGPALRTWLLRVFLKQLFVAGVRGSAFLAGFLRGVARIARVIDAAVASRNALPIHARTARPTLVSIRARRLTAPNAQPARAGTSRAAVLLPIRARRISARSAVSASTLTLRRALTYSGGAFPSAAAQAVRQKFPCSNEKRTGLGSKRHDYDAQVVILSRTVTAVASETLLTLVNSR